MPHETLTTRDLVSDAKQGRFLQELSDHLEDSGDPTAIGAPAELARSFNGYARPKRNLRIVAVLCVSTLSFTCPAVTVFWMMLGNPPWHEPFPSPWYELQAIVPILGMLFEIPVTFLFILPTVTVNNFMFEHGLYGHGLLGAQVFNGIENAVFPMVPFVSCIFWTAVAIALLFKPYEIFKRNLKRRA